MYQQDVIFSSKHPKAIYLLAATEMCQRFAYFGVYYLLVLFFTQYWGYPVAKATLCFAAYTGIAALLHLLGGYVADKWSAQATIPIGLFLTGAGCFFLALLRSSFLLPALGLVSLGGALMTPTMYSLLGSLYTKRYHIREGGFAIYYALVNLGSCCALLLLGFLQTFSWSITFLVAGCLSLVGLLPYACAAKKLKMSTKFPHHFVSKENDPHTFPLKRHEKERLFVIVLMTLAAIFFWIAYNQLGSSLTLFAATSVKRTIGTFSFPAPWLIALYFFLVALFAFPLAHLYLFLRRIKSNASPPMRTALSLFFLGLCFIVMQRGAATVQAGTSPAQVSPSYLIIAFALMALAELFITPIFFSLVTYLSPHRYQGLLTGFWFTCMAIGLYLGGYFARWMETINLSSFFDIFMFLALVPAFLIVLFSKKLDTMRHIDGR